MRALYKLMLESEILGRFLKAPTGMVSPSAPGQAAKRPVLLGQLRAVEIQASAKRGPANHRVERLAAGEEVLIAAAAHPLR